MLVFTSFFSPLALIPYALELMTVSACTVGEVLFRTKSMSCVIWVSRNEKKETRNERMEVRGKSFLFDLFDSFSLSRPRAISCSRFKRTGSARSRPDPWGPDNSYFRACFDTDMELGEEASGRKQDLVVNIARL